MRIDYCYLNVECIIFSEETEKLNSPHSAVSANHFPTPAPFRHFPVTTSTCNSWSTPPTPQQRTTPRTRAEWVPTSGLWHLTEAQNVLGCACPGLEKKRCHRGAEEKQQPPCSVQASDLSQESTMQGVERAKKSRPAPASVIRRPKVQQYPGVAGICD